MSTLDIVMSAAGVGATNWISSAQVTGYGAEGYSTTTDASGNVYTCGYTNSADGQAGLLIKYDSSGVLQWSRTLTYSAGNYIIAHGVALDSSGNVYVCGRNRAYTGQLIKYDSSGTLQWQKAVSGAYLQSYYGIAIDSSSNIYVVGAHQSSIFDQENAMIVKFNSSGVVQWARLLNGGTYESSRKVCVDTSGNVYYCGVAQYQNTMMFVKYNSSGTRQLIRQLVHPGTMYPAFNGIYVDNSGYVYLCGYYFEGRVGVVVKMNTDQTTVLWQRTLDSGQYDYLNDIVVDGSGNVYIVGTQTDNGGTSKGIIFKYNSSGVLQWQRYLQNSSPVSLSSIKLSGTKNFVVCGTLGSSGEITAVFPVNGTLTGTYGSWVYTESALTDAAGGLVDGSVSLTESSPTFSSADSSYTPGSPAMVNTVISI